MSADQTISWFALLVPGLVAGAITVFVQIFITHRRQQFAGEELSLRLCGPVSNQDDATGSSRGGSR